VRRDRCAKGWSIAQLSKTSGVLGRLIREMEGGSSTYVLAEALRVPAGPLLEQREGLFEGVAAHTSSDSLGGLYSADSV
jgi:hypothetical protein